mmetsp:Transcript_100539/g.284879  ORF Transcript_100539/g.284879 Transcript_100539/m.284879 type:complete len:147 (+) Transcript_100539:1-441(+)
MLPPAPPPPRLAGGAPLMAAATPHHREVAVDEWPSPQATAFRRWSSADSRDGERVPGLRGALGAAGLASYTAAAESWCADMGAAFLDELVGEFEGLGAELQGPAGSSGPSREQLRQLYCILVARSGGPPQGAQAQGPHDHEHRACK